MTPNQRIYADLLAETTHGLNVNGQAAFYYLKAANFERERANFIRQIKECVSCYKYSKLLYLESQVMTNCNRLYFLFIYK